jgi:hypothetical protein
VVPGATPPRVTVERYAVPSAHDIDAAWIASIEDGIATRRSMGTEMRSVNPPSSVKPIQAAIREQSVSSPRRQAAHAPHDQ